MQVQVGIEVVLYVLSGFVAGGMAGWLTTRSVFSRRLESVRKELSAQHDKFMSVSNSLAAANTRLEEIDGLKDTLSRREDELRSLQQQIAEHQKQNAELETTLAGYLESAKQELKNREKAVNEVVQPIADALERYGREVRSMEREREKAYGELSQQVGSLAQTQTELQRETGKLVNALRMPHVRGRWGEITLRRVVEISGMQNRCDFFEQVSTQTEDGVARPDMVIQLPGERRIIVDSKVSITAYLDALELDSRDESEDMLSRHARHVQTHVQKLAQKSYWSQFKPSPEFVVLFMPGENFFSAALAKMPELIEEAANKGVILATPTTLISLLKAVAYGWKQQTAAENARAVSELGNELYNRFRSMIGHMNKLGKDLDRSVTTFNQTIGSMDKRVMPAARRLQEMGMTLNNGKPLSDLSPVEEKPGHILNEENNE